MLVEVEKCGLFIYPSTEYIAPSPHRLIMDPSCSPSEGIKEIKVLTKATVIPEKFSWSGKGAYLKVDSESVVHLSKPHNYYNRKWRRHRLGTGGGRP